MPISKYEASCLFPVVQTVVAGVASVANSAVLGCKLPCLIYHYIFRDHSSDKLLPGTGFDIQKRSVSKTLNDLSESTSRMVPIYGTIVAGKTFGLTTAESLCLIPGVNIGVGLATVAQNVGKIALFILTFAFTIPIKGVHRAIIFLANYCGNTPRKKASRQAINFINNLHNNLFKSIARSADYTVRGFGRALPVLSTGYYFAKINK